MVIRTRGKIALSVAAVTSLVLSGCGAGGSGGGGGDDKTINVLMVGNPQMVDIEKLTKDTSPRTPGSR